MRRLVKALAPVERWLAVTALAAAIYGWLVFATTFTHPGAIGLNYNAVGADWLVYYGAVQSYFDGDLARIFDGDHFTAFLNQHYGFWLSEDLEFRPWVYPPSYLMLLLPFGLLGPLASLAVFQVTTAAALAAATIIGSSGDNRSARAIALCALLCPAASINALCGQNAFLSAAILVAGFRLLEKQTLLAGAVLGLMTIKPQFAILLPIALAAGRQWRALFAAAATALILIIVSALTFGVDAWTTWLRATMINLVSADGKWTEAGRMWGDSVWTCAISLGASRSVATLLQWAFFLGAVAAVAAAFRYQMACRLSVLLAATLLAAPYWSGYDSVLLTLAGLYWVVQRPPAESQTWRWILMLTLWIAPLASPPVLMPAGRLLPLLIAGFLVAAIRLGPTAIRKPAAVPA